MTILFWKYGGLFRSILYKLGNMEMYIDFIQSATFDEISIHKNFIENNWSDEEKVELYNDDYEGEDHAEKWIANWNEELKSLFYASFLMSWYSFTENQLSELCDKLEIKYNRKGGYIGKYKIAPIHWNEYKTISKLRNKIIHDSRGRLKYKVGYDTKTFKEFGKEYSKTDIKEFGVGTKIWIRFETNFDRNTCKYSERHQLLRFIDGGLYIVPDNKYSKHLINFGREFFMKIQDDLYQMEKTSGIKL